MRGFLIFNFYFVTCLGFFPSLCVVKTGQLHNKTISLLTKQYRTNAGVVVLTTSAGEFRRT